MIVGPLEPEDVRRHLAGEMTLGIYAINPETQRVKWMAIDADYRQTLLKTEWWVWIGCLRAKG